VTPPGYYDDEDRSRGSSRAATPNGAAYRDGGSPGAAADEIGTNLFDRRGFCVRHPDVRLRRRRMLGGWQVLVANCPACCEDEIRRLKRVKREKRRVREEKEEEGEGKGGKMKRKPSRKRLDDSSASRSRGKSRGRDGKGRSKSRSRKEEDDLVDSRHSGDGGEDGGPIFEFDIPFDDRPDPSFGEGGGKSVKSGRSRRSAKSTKSSRTNKSGKSTRTSSKSKSRSKSKARSKSKSRPATSPGTGGGGGDDTVVSRSTVGSATRFIRPPGGGRLRVAKMPYSDVHGRSGLYTGEIDERGRPHGRGVLRYGNGTAHEGTWTEGHDPDMDLGGRTSAGFTDWRGKTRAGERQREARKEREMDDLRSFVSASVRSGGGSVATGARSRGPNFDDHARVNRRGGDNSGGSGGGPARDQVHEMPWSDVNGFGGHYTGDVNASNVPDGRGYMQYSNGVVEEGLFRNGVYQPDPDAAGPDGEDEGGPVPSSSMSVWSLKSSPTMAMGAGGAGVLGGGTTRIQMPPGGMGSVPGSSVHGGGAEGGDPYGNDMRRY